MCSSHKWTGILIWLRSFCAFSVSLSTCLHHTVWTYQSVGMSDSQWHTLFCLHRNGQVEMGYEISLFMHFNWGETILVVVEMSPVPCILVMFLMTADTLIVSRFQITVRLFVCLLLASYVCLRLHNRLELFFSNGGQASSIFYNLWSSYRTSCGVLSIEFVGTSI